LNCLKILDFHFSWETIRFEWKDIQTEIASSNRLMFRSLDQVGDDAFIVAIAQVSSQSLDRSRKAKPSQTR
jgi:hypothetical protein